tara:strand:+ start:114 stop:356 length:243 start_codon:yes stop_codon:yes gene_type:complete
MSDDAARVPDAWIEVGATFIYDLHRAGILYDIDDMTDEEVAAALAKVRNPQYNRSLLQAPRVISEKPTSYAGLVSAPQNA